MINHSVMIEEWCLPGHQRDQPLVLCNIFINDLKHKVCKVLTKLVDDTKCTGDVKERNEDLHDLIITAWIKSKQKKLPTISTYGTRARYKKGIRKIICGIEDLLRHDPEGRSGSSGWQLKINMNSTYNTAANKDQVQYGPKIQKNSLIGYHIKDHSPFFHNCGLPHQWNYCFLSWTIDKKAHHPEQQINKRSEGRYTEK